MARLPKPGEALRYVEKINGFLMEVTVIGKPQWFKEPNREKIEWGIQVRWNNAPHGVTVNDGYVPLEHLENGKVVIVKDQKEKDFFLWMYQQDIRISAGLFDSEGEPE